MNYGKNEVEKTLCKTNSRAQKITSHLVLLLTKIILILVLFAAVLGISFGYGIFKGVIDAAPEIDVASIEPSGYATMVYDSKGNLTETLVKSGANRLEASYEELPQCLIDAFVAIEDSRFWSHKGVDVRSMVRAAVGIITGDSSAGGGSTLTQQLIKNNIFEGGNEDTFGEKLERKIQEQYLAIQLEKIMDKKIILKNYLNTINLGNNTLGVKAAALRYFDKDVSSSRSQRQRSSPVSPRTRRDSTRSPKTEESATRKNAASSSSTCTSRGRSRRKNRKRLSLMTFTPASKTWISSQRRPRLHTPTLPTS